MQKVTISGSYRTKNNEVVNYSKITGMVPDCDADTLQSVILHRYSEMWLVQSDVKERVYSIREAFIDKVEHTNDIPSFVGKDIKELTFEELQDLATAKGLRGIPLWHKGSLREAQLKAYKIYSSEVLKRKVPDDKTYAELPSIVLDAKVKMNDIMPPSNEEILGGDTDAQEDVAAPNPTNMDFEQLKQLADSKGIKYHPSIGYDTLYAKIFK